MGVDGDLEVGPELLQVIPVDLRRRLVFEDEVLAADADDAVHLAGEHEAAGGRAGRRIDDGALEVLLQRDDLEVFGRIARRVGRHHRGGEMPVPALVLILEPVGAEPVDEGQHFGQVAPLVPRLQALVDDRAEVQIPVAAERNELLEVAPVHRLAAVPEQTPHRVGRDHGCGGHVKSPETSRDWRRCCSSGDTSPACSSGKQSTP